MKKILLIGILFLAILLIILLTKTMDKKILVFLGVVLLVGAAVLVFNKTKNKKYQYNYLSESAPVSSGKASAPSDVPSEYGDLYIEKNICS